MLCAGARESPYGSNVNHSGPGGVGAPRGPDHKEQTLMATKRIPRQETKREISRTILREAEQRFRHELMDDEARQVLRDRVLKLRRELRLRA
jgi:transposase-like protein